MVGYEYDSQNQLTKEIYYTYLPHSYNPSSTTTYEYTYDTSGNLLTESKNGTVTKTYTYGDSQWKDLLTKYTTGGVSYSLTYDAIGNPTTYYLGEKAYTLTWEHGRQLAGIKTKTSGSAATIDSTSLNFRYDADGIRTEKSSGTGLSLTTHTYVTQNGKIIRETIKNRKSTQILDFLYDNTGKPFALKYSTDGGSSFTTYYYVLNLQGDVVALMDKDGAVVARYTYSAWGEIRSVTDANGAAIASASHIANLNPLRYRGYYYDTETGFYYLQSRYYDPVMKRFINADSYESTGQGFIGTNMYVYCINNPVITVDTSGSLAGMVIGSLWGGVKGFFKAKSAGKSTAEAFCDALHEGAKGALFGLAADVAVATGGVGGLIIAGGAGVVSTLADYSEENGGLGEIREKPAEFILDTTINVGFNMLSFGMAAVGLSKSLKEFGKKLIQQLTGETSRQVGRRTVQYGVGRIAKQIAGNLTYSLIETTLFAGAGWLTKKKVTALTK